MESPILELPECHMNTESREKPMFGYYDGSGNYQNWQNSAGEVFEKAPTRKVCTIIRKISRNYDITLNTDALAQQYVNKLNQDSWWGWPAGTVLCTGMEVEPKRQNLPDESYYDYLRITWTFEHSNEDADSGEAGFSTQLLDVGSYYLSSGSGGVSKVAFKTAEGHRYVGKLDGAGNPLSDGASPVWLPARKKYSSVIFSSLGLPQQWADVKNIYRGVV
jgi:hypothetical protein